MRCGSSRVGTDGALGFARAGASAGSSAGADCTGCCCTAGICCIAGVALGMVDADDGDGSTGTCDGMRDAGTDGCGRLWGVGGMSVS